MITSQKDVLNERRRRLSDISWWMRCTAEVIARRANMEDECTGRFWEGRYKAQLLLDDAAVLACAAYVDLNPIRAALAKTPESSEFTGAKDRIDDLAERESETGNTHTWERSRRRQRSGWLSPVEIRDARDPAGPNASGTGMRASDRGFLGCSLLQYLKLLDWSGRQLRRKKRGRIPEHLAPLLTRLGLDGTGWCQLVSRFGKMFKRAAGTHSHLQAEASRRGQSWMQAPGNLLAPE